MTEGTKSAACPNPVCMRARDHDGRCRDANGEYLTGGTKEQTMEPAVNEVAPHKHSPEEMQRYVDEGRCPWCSEAWRDQLIAELRSAQDAMQKRAEAAESDWQACESTVAELRETIGKDTERIYYYIEQCNGYTAEIVQLRESNAAKDAEIAERNAVMVRQGDGIERLIQQKADLALQDAMAIAALKQQLAEREKERAELTAALRNHLCQYDMADWIGCSGVHTKEDGTIYCEVCDEVSPHSHEIAALQSSLSETVSVLDDIIERLQKYDFHRCDLHEVMDALNEAIALRQKQKGGA